MLSLRFMLGQFSAVLEGYDQPMETLVGVYHFPVFWIWTGTEINSDKVCGDL